MYAELKQIVCPQCKQTKEIKDFGKDCTTARGISSWCKLCKKAWRSAHRKENPQTTKAKDFDSDLRRNYGISAKEYGALFDSQGGKCACCSQDHTLFKRRLHVDHDHSTGQVRGLLCTECNPGLGYFQDSVERLEMAIKYLSKFKK
jgi:hypothetical protein